MRAWRSAWLACACAVAAAACGDDARAKAHAADVASFDQVWTTVRDQHFDPTFGGVDWDAARRELRPKVLAARSREEARVVMRAMLAHLQQSHFAIIETGPDAGDAEHDGTFGLVGFDVRSVGGEILVTRLDAAGPAEREGVKLGWRIDAIDGKPVAALLGDVRAHRAGEATLLAEECQVIQDELMGSTRQPIEVVFDDGAGGTVTKVLPRDAAGDRIATYGYMSGLVEFQAGWVGTDWNIGYLRIGAFLDPATVMKRYRETLGQMGQARGMIIDLRGNGGGLGTMASGMLGELVRREVVLGTDRLRESQRKSVANPQPGAYEGPIVVLVDELSMSASETFTAAVQELGRGRVIGRRTPGAVLTSAFERLPNGDTLQYAFGEYVTRKGQRLEGVGVQPDDVVALTRADLLAGTDVAVDKAIAWLESETTP